LCLPARRADATVQLPIKVVTEQEERGGTDALLLNVSAHACGDLPLGIAVHGAPIAKKEHVLRTVIDRSRRAEVESASEERRGAEAEGLEEATAGRKRDVKHTDGGRIAGSDLARL